MGDDLDERLVGVRADTDGFARDVARMRATLEGSLGEGAERAGRVIEAALLRAAKTGEFGFDQLKQMALAALAEIARAALETVLGPAPGAAPAGTPPISGVLAAALGLAGRATGGPVSPGQAYVVGERGPELFVPTAAGRVEPGGGGGREVRVAITVNAAAGEAPAALQRSSRQVARAVRAALEG